jgi:hypothetical protein
MQRKKNFFRGSFNEAGSIEAMQRRMVERRIENIWKEEGVA